MKFVESLALPIAYYLENKEDTWEEAKKDLANVDFIKTLIVRNA